MLFRSSQPRCTAGRSRSRGIYKRHPAIPTRSLPISTITSCEPLFCTPQSGHVRRLRVRSVLCQTHPPSSYSRHPPTSTTHRKRCQEMLNQFNAAHPYQPYQPGTSPMGHQGSGFQSQSFNDPFPGFAGSFGFGGGYSGQPYATQSEMGPGFGNQPFPSQSTGFGHSSFPGHRPGSGFGFSSFNNAAPQPEGFPQPQTSHPPPPSGGSFGAPPPSMPGTSVCLRGLCTPACLRLSEKRGVLRSTIIRKARSSRSEYPSSPSTFPKGACGPALRDDMWS